MNKVFLLVILFSATLQAQSVISPKGFFVTLNDKAGVDHFPDRAIIGDKQNPRLAIFPCISGFQAEGMIAVSCPSNDPKTPNLFAGMLYLGGSGQLNFFNRGSGPILLTLNCEAQPGMTSTYFCK